MGKWRKSNKSRGGSRHSAPKVPMNTAWWRPGHTALSQMAGPSTVTGETLIMAAKDLIPQPAAVLDRERWIKILRLMCRIVLIVTGGGNASALRVWYGWRIADLNAGGSAAAASVDVRLGGAADKQEDWLYRKEVAFNVAAADSNAVKTIGQGGDSTLFFDCQPLRKLQYGQGLILSYGLTVLAGSFSAGATVDASCTPEILIGGVV